MSIYARRPARILAGVLAGALALSVTPILGFSGTAGALDPPTGDGSVCEDVTPATEPFTDVQANDVAINEIICLVATGITKGVTATTYEPTSPVTRRQMALFLVRLADEIAEHAVPGQVTPVPAGDGVTPFTDISAESAEVKVAVDRLNQAGIAQGVTATRFVPGDTVTRRQMAKFIVRLQEFMAGADVTPDNAPNAFTDDNGDSGEAELNVLAAEGVFVGNAAPNAGTVSPGANISRRQMALVIIRKAQYLFEEGVITRLFPEDDSNATLAVTPAAAAENTVSAGAPNENRGARTYTVTGLTAGTTYDIRLYPCADVTNTAGQFSFADVGNDGEADLNGTGAVIETVNGAAVNNDNTEAQPVNGTITFTIDNTTANQCVVPVIFVDTENDDTLELNAQDRPTEVFGVGGAKSWIPAEPAAAGVVGATDQNVLSVNKTTDRIVTPNGTFFYDANDSFFLRTTDSDDAAANACVPGEQVTLAQFEAALSTGDELDASSFYQPEATLPSSFCLEDIEPDAPTLNAFPTSPTTLGVNITNIDPGATVQVYWSNDDADPGDTDGANFPTNFTLVTVTDTDPNTPGIQGSITIPAPTPPSPDGPGNCGPGERDFTVAATQTVDGDVSPPTFDIDECVSDLPEAVGPISTDAEITTNAGFAGRLDTGDVLKACFDEALRAPDAGDAVEIVDADGDIATLTNGGNATFALGAAVTPDVGDADDGLPESCPANQTLVITITGAVADQNQGIGDTILNTPAEVTDHSGVTDVVGNAWDIGGSSDVLFDFNAGDDAE